LTEQPIPIRDQRWPEGTQPVASIFCLTYNQQDFLRQALESILMQETTFPVEIYVHDDASTDNTQNIIEEYKAKHPTLLVKNIQNTNNYSKTGYRFIFKCLNNLKGEFVAICEGDDFWTVPGKLQKQIDILKKDQTVALVFHNSWVRHDQSKNDFFLNQNIDKTRFSLCEIIERDWFIATASMVFRKGNRAPENLWEYVMGGDMLIQLTSCRTGDAVYLDEVMSVYRRHGSGVSNEFWKHGVFHFEKLRPNHIWMYWVFSETLTLQKSKDAIQNRILDLMTRICKYAIKHRFNSLNRKPQEELAGYLKQLLLKNKPSFRSEEELAIGGRFYGLIKTASKKAWAENKKEIIKTQIKKIAQHLFKK
jgi:glycosyltransferase involved in cell wall biosynthesis